VFLRQKRAACCAAVGAALMEIGETQKAGELFRQAEDIRRQLEQMR